MILILTVILTAIASSALTLGVGYWLFQQRIQPLIDERLRTEWAEAEETLQTRVRDGALEAMEESKLMDQLQGIGEQVRQGALAAIVEAELEKKLAALEVEIERRVRNGALEAMEESKLMDQLQGIGEQVRLGALAAIVDAELEEKLAALEVEIERRVRKGVVDGITSMATAGPLRDTTLNMTGAGATLVGESLGALFSGLAKSIAPLEDDDDDDD